MIHSMTGYAGKSLDLARNEGERESAGSARQLHLELRGVNSRFFDLHFRLDDELRALEPKLREKIAAQVRRGKVECRLGLNASSREAGERLDRAVLQVLARQEEEARAFFPEATPLGIHEILRWPGVLAERAETRCHDPEVFALLDVVLAEFNAARAREGEKLAAILLEYGREMRAIVAEIVPHIPAAEAAFAERLRQRLREIAGEADEGRILQEVALFAARIDVAEELARLNTHLDELERILKEGGAVGKRLDFLMQELNREANTLASKSAVMTITQAAMHLKLLIEQMREQAQNLE
ncbi:MAG: YicC family protein [Zoogloeaceae bacterium]|nr:YicC family protein [Zoogloeaceae bacterium]